MSARDASASAPPSWAATQQWLDDLDQDAPAHSRGDDGWPAEPDYDGEPTDLDVVDADDDATPVAEFDDADEQPTVPLDDADEQPTVPLGDASEQATVRLDNAFGRDYTPADPGSDDAHRDPDPQPYFDDTDDADLYDTEPTDLDVMAPDVLDAHHNPADSAPPADEPADPPRFNKAVAVGFIAATVVATIGVTATLLAMRSSPQPEPEQASPTTQISVAPAPASPPPTDAGADTPIPYTASAPGCPPGSSAAQAVAGTDPTQAWVCGRNGADGQVLQIDLGRPMVVTAISLTPGWVGADATGADQWLQHRVLTRVQWNLFNGNETTPTVVPQKTGNVRGEAPQPMPNGGVLASRITMIVQETSRAPADTAPTTAAPGEGGGGLLDDVLGAPLGPPPTNDPGPAPLPGLPGEHSATDPADNTFAVSSIKILGHPPR